MSTTDVVMPQMGESIAEGTIVRWIKKVGDSVERDEPLFEISTDKVDAEIPSPAAGVLAEIRAREGDTVPVNSVVATIAAAGAAVTPAPAVGRAPLPTDRMPTPSGSPSAPVATPAPIRSGDELRPEDVARQRSSPLVRRIAKEHGVDLSRVPGRGVGGRVTKDDILAFVARQSQPGGSGARGPAAARSPQPAVAHGGAVPGTTVPMSVMRKKIADHMVLSRRTSAHAYTVFDVNFARVAKRREERKADYERQGTKLTYLSYVLKAVATALKAMPLLNASIDGENIVYHKDVNIGIAVALDWGLLVPVVKRADEKDLLELSRSIADLAARARTKQLKPEEVTGGTFTVTNPGAVGLFGLPIINQPQVAILGLGSIEKRAVVIEDAIGIRPVAYVSLGFDHRIVDGVVANAFMSHVKTTIENWDDHD